MAWTFYVTNFRQTSCLGPIISFKCLLIQNFCSSRFFWITRDITLSKWFLKIFVILQLPACRSKIPELHFFICYLQVLQPVAAQLTFTLHKIDTICECTFYSCVTNNVNKFWFYFQITACLCYPLLRVIKIAVKTNYAISAFWKNKSCGLTVEINLTKSTN